jgi:F-type H+-transporting ATPase subunit gamma
MDNLRVIKRRIKSISGIRQITKAMEMVAATKLKRAQARIESARPYIEKLDEIMRDILSGSTAEELEHPFTVQPDVVKKAVLIVITSDKGLCGSFNANLIRRAVSIMEEGRKDGIEYGIIPIGRKGLQYFTRRGANILRTDLINIDQGLPIVFLNNLYTYLVGLYAGSNPDSTDKTGIYDRIDIVYALFKNAMIHRIQRMTLLPLAVGISAGEPGAFGQTQEYIFEPGPVEVFNDLLPQTVKMNIFSALANTIASEQGTRMIAMRNATDNAGDLIDWLTLQRNKARQSAITKELSDIVGGAEALK